MADIDQSRSRAVTTVNNSDNASHSELITAYAATAQAAALVYLADVLRAAFVK